MEHQGFQLSTLKKLVDDCFSPNPWIYWSDFLLSVTLGYSAFVITELLPLFSLGQILAYLVSVFALYRAVLFIHELTHQERRALPYFSLAYNLLVGVPTLFPSFMYRGVHIDHHKKNSYGTNEDGEYLPFGASAFAKTIFYIAQSAFLPFLLVFRFGLLTPISFLHPSLRRFVMVRNSSLAIRFDTSRRIPKGVDLRNWLVQELLCFFYLFALALLFATGVLGMGTLVHMYLFITGTFLVNSLRTVVAHRYRNRSAEPMSFHDQLLDSVNLEGNALIGELVAPVGLRFHALHHLFPTLPYHNLALAHRRLRESLPPQSFYHATVEPSLWAALCTHWRNTRAIEETPEVPAQV